MLSTLFFNCNKFGEFKRIFNLQKGQGENGAYLSRARELGEVGRSQIEQYALIKKLKAETF